MTAAGGLLLGLIGFYDACYMFLEGLHMVFWYYWALQG